MRLTLKADFLTIAVFAIGIFQGCSGGGSTGPSAAKMVTGAAATGAPLKGLVTPVTSATAPVTAPQP